MGDSLNWSVYIIRCSDNSLYTGITTDIPRRFHQHATRQGAKYFRARQPETLVYIESGHNRVTASRREVEIKKLRRNKKLQLIVSSEDNLERIILDKTFHRKNHEGHEVKTADYAKLCV